jgi:hypothetical protein
MQRTIATFLLAGFTGAMPTLAGGQTLQDLPSRKPGHWELRMVTTKPGGTPDVVSQVCIDASTDRQLMEFGLRVSKDLCKRYAMKHEGKALVIDAECKFGPMKSVTRTTMSGDYQSSYTVKVDGTTEGGFAGLGGGKGPQPTSMVQTARWTSAQCGNGMKPGDFTMPGGIKVNIKQMQGLRKMLPQILGK